MKKLLKITFTLIIITILLLGFAVPVNMVGNWYQQFMPDLGNRSISDITFVDSLVGYAVTRKDSLSENFVLKTINGGDNWNIVQSYNNSHIKRVIFLNKDTGYVGGTAIPQEILSRTTDGGLSWTLITVPEGFLHDMYVLNTDTIWISDQLFTGRLFITTNGGTSWQLQYTNNNGIDKIYMFNRNIGFLSSNFNLFKTTNSGFNWTQIPGEFGFLDIYFVDSLTGWKTRGDTMKFTSNGGLNWTKQIAPYGGIILSNVISRFANINKDTLWATGGSVWYLNNQVKRILYRTTNGGSNWLFQIPDTTLKFGTMINFSNKEHGWVYSNSDSTGIHTATGGDTTFYIGIQQTNTYIPKEFELKQNYPNPFNPRTVIPYKLKKSAFVRLIAYEITGRETQIMVNQHQQAGEYEVDFIGKFAISSGIYFYRIEVTDDKSKQLYTETKKMILIK